MIHGMIKIVFWPLGHTIFKKNLACILKRPMPETSQNRPECVPKCKNVNFEHVFYYPIIVAKASLSASYNVL